MGIIDDINFLLKIDELKDYLKEENISTYTRKGETLLHFSLSCFLRVMHYETINKNTNENLMSLTEINFDASCKDCLTTIGFREDISKDNPFERGLMVSSLVVAIHVRENFLTFLKTYKEKFSKGILVEDITLYFEELLPLLLKFEGGYYSIPVNELHDVVESLDKEVTLLLKENTSSLKSQEMLESLTETAIKTLVRCILSPINSSPVTFNEEIKENVKTLEQSIIKQYRSATKLTVFRKEWLNKKLTYGKTAFQVQCEAYNEAFYLKDANLMVLPTVVLQGLLTNEKVSKISLTSANGYEVDSLSKDEFETMNALILTTPSVEKAYLIAKTV